MPTPASTKSPIPKSTSPPKVTFENSLWIGSWSKSSSKKVRKVEVLGQHVAGRASVEAPRDEAADVPAEQRVGGSNLRSGGKGRDEERGSQNGTTHEQPPWV